MNNSLEMTPEAFRQLGYQAVDLIADALGRWQQRREPARRPVPQEIRELLHHQPLPRHGRSPEALLSFVAENIFPYSLGHNNPRFFAWVNSPAAPISVLGELLAAGMNASAAGGDQASTYLEHAVLNWLKEIMGFPLESGGLLVSGGSMATVVGLAVMRYVKSNGQVREQGMHQSPLVVYTSTEGHSCVQKAVELLGIGHRFLRKIPADGNFRMDLAALKLQIDRDRAAGLVPACVVGSAGTVNTGAIDPLDEIADLCAQEGMWFHVDGAFGGVARLAPQAADHFLGIERADSLGIDPHKWMYIPIECGCVLVRDQQAMQDTFSLVPEYLRDDRQLPWFAEFGPQQTRAFRALKLWLAIGQIGLEGYRDLIERDIELARLLQKKVREDPDFELVSTSPLSVTCFLYAPAGADNLERLNQGLLEVVQEEGTVYLTHTRLNGRFVLRANIVNFRTEEADLDVLLDRLRQAGERCQKL